MVEIAIPGVPALPAPPALTDANLAADELAWQADEDEWARAASAAAQAARGAATKIRSFPLDRKTYSGIHECMAALAVSGPRGPGVHLLLASDLEKTEQAMTADYGGSSVWVVQSCPAGHESRCTTLGSTWRQEMLSEGASVVTVVRADAASDAIQAWLGGSS